MTNAILELTASLADLDGGRFTFMVGPEDVTFYMPEGAKLAISHASFTEIQRLMKNYVTATALVETPSGAAA